MDHCEDPLTSGRRRVIVTSDIRNGWRDGVTILNTTVSFSKDVFSQEAVNWVFLGLFH